MTAAVDLCLLLMNHLICFDKSERSNGDQFDGEDHLNAKTVIAGLWQTLGSNLSWVSFGSRHQKRQQASNYGIIFT
jgi:hypothetical protein